MEQGLFGGLNGQQQLAATYGRAGEQGVESGPVLIIAGAGTGKTMTLAHRTAFLLINGVAPERILMLTFSRRAAREMADRAIKVASRQLAQKRGGNTPVKLAWSGTFHSVGSRLLRMHASGVGLDPGFTIMDQADSADLMDLLRHELDLTRADRRFPKKMTCFGIYSQSVNRQMALETVLETYYPWCIEWNEELVLLFRAYIKAKQQQSLLDYDDLLLHWMWLCENRELAERVSSQFDHILVDEYQDTNILQARILNLLRPAGNGLTVVGDDAQSIYGFRAAEVENILQFPNGFTPPAQVIPLEQNYRSCQPILDFSNALLGESPRAYRKSLYSDKQGGCTPELVSVESDQDQAMYIVDRILLAREAGAELRDQAVLFRNGHHSDRLEVELVRRDIPYVKYGGLKFLESGHVKDALSILRWAENPKNRVAGFRVLKLVPGIGPVLAARALDHLAQNHHNFKAYSGFRMPHGDSGLWLELVGLLRQLADEEHAWHGQLEQVRKWYQPVLELNYDDHFVRIGDIEQLEMIGAHYANRQQFLAELTLDPPVASGDLAASPRLDDDFLILSTIHSAKGQEWKNVYILNVNDGNFPNEFACGDPARIEEERRLLYVASTRAKESLSLIYPLKYWVPEQARFGDKHVYGAKSRFLTPEVMKHLGVSSFGNIHQADRRMTGETPLVDLRERANSMF
ncbi:MAG: ATP-dependent helicase [Xanthomonadales bacterium]|jgi:DNA helicase-2/ATP-dependent DNA helicase PcrA|nr:ATP-dependent helicase [Xanthomonadales bacterium]